MLLRAEAGTERWVQWARKAAAELEELRRRLKLPFLSRSYQPEPGTTVFVKTSEAGPAINIMGGDGDTRLWDPLPADPLSIQVRGPAVLKTQPYEAADWAKGFATFARWTGTEVALLRDGDETALADTLRLAHHEATTLYRNETATMSRDGKTAVVLPAAPTDEHVASVYRWDRDAAEFALTRVPLPPDALARTGPFGAGTPSLGADGYYTQGGVELGRSPTPDSTQYGDHVWTGTIAWKAFVDPRRTDRVYVDVRAQTLAVTTALLRTSFETGIPAPLTPHVEGYDEAKCTEFREIWSYEIATGAWTLEHAEDAAPHTMEYVSLTQYISDGTAYGFQPHADVTAAIGSTTVPTPAYYTVAFGPDGMQVVSFDNRSLPQLASVTTLGSRTSSGGVPGPSATYDYTSYSANARLTAADVLLDSDPWVAAASITAAEGAAGLTVAHMGDERRGAIATLVAGTTTTYWVHEDGLATYTGTVGRVYSRGARWMYLHTSAYRNGVLQYTLTGADVFYVASATHDDRVLMSLTASTVVHVQGGTATFATLGAVSIPTAGPPFTDGISLDGQTLYVSGSAIAVGGFLGPFQLLSLAGNGSLYDLTLAGTQVFGIYRMAGGAGAYAPALKREVAEVYTVDATSYTFPRTKVIPDEFVVG